MLQTPLCGDVFAEAFKHTLTIFKSSLQNKRYVLRFVETQEDSLLKMTKCVNFDDSVSSTVFIRRKMNVDKRLLSAATAGARHAFAHSFQLICAASSGQGVL